MKKYAFPVAFAIGALAVLWVAAAVASSHLLVLVMTTVIGAVYVFGALELRHYRNATTQLAQALTDVPPGLQHLADWLSHVPAPLRNAVRQRIEGERNTLPGPAFTPYLVGLLVMLGMLGTFLGMVITLNGAVFALEGASSVQGMRAAFSEPIKGLGLAFGTSVAGVATSAMLGLMSSLVRRERSHVAQTLDGLIGSDLRHFSLAHQRQESYKALQQQSQALPLVMQQLQSLMTHMEHHSQLLNDRLQAQQAQFHSEVKTVYTDLARSVDASMRSSLSHSMQVASDSIRPVVQATMAEMAQQTQTQHERMVDSTRQQLDTLQQQFSANALQLAQTCSSAVRQQEENSAALHDQVQQTLTQMTERFEQQSTALLDRLRSSHNEQKALQRDADEQRLSGWKTSLQDMAAALHQQNSQTLADIQRLMTGNEELLRARTASEAEWTQQQQQRAEGFTALMREQLSSLREQEAQRGEAAVARLAELQTVVTQNLSTLGSALEAPITRLIEAASEAPKAAAEVIGQMRQEISASAARDNALLEERTRILDTLNTLLAAIHHASSEQRGVIDSLVAAGQQALASASGEFHAKVNAETDKLGEISAQVTASAIDVASLGETFGFAVRAFSESNDKLTANLQRIEAAIAQSMTRSDEQLAYYVAQAREIIDLSISSQKDVLEALQQRQAQGAA